MLEEKGKSSSTLLFIFYSFTSNKGGELLGFLAAAFECWCIAVMSLLRLRFDLAAGCLSSCR